MPKRELNFMKCEVVRFYRLLTAGAGCIEPVSMTVPRKVMRKAMGQQIRAKKIGQEADPGLSSNGCGFESGCCKLKALLSPLENPLLQVAKT